MNCCHQHALEAPKSQCTAEQVQKLEEYTREMWTGIVPEQNSRGYFDPLPQKIIDSIVENPISYYDHNFHKLQLEHLEISEGYPIAWKNNEGKVMFVQLRPITSEKNKLLLGCGNNPTSVCFHYPMSSEFENECIIYGSECFGADNTWAKMIISQTRREQESGMVHTHEGYTTIDPNPVMNPDIVGLFGWYKIPSELIPDSSMSEIYSEGISLDSCRYTDDEYKRITGKIKNGPIREIWYD